MMRTTNRTGRQRVAPGIIKITRRPIASGMLIVAALTVLLVVPAAADDGVVLHDTGVRFDARHAGYGLEFTDGDDFLALRGETTVRIYDLRLRQWGPHVNVGSSPGYLLSLGPIEDTAIDHTATRLAHLNVHESKIQIIDIGSGAMLDEFPMPYLPERATHLDELYFGVGGDLRNTLVIKKSQMRRYYFDIASAEWTSIDSQVHTMSRFGAVAEGSEEGKVEYRPSLTSDDRYSVTLGGRLIDVVLSPDGDALLIGERRVDHAGRSEDVWYFIDPSTRSAVGRPWTVPMEQAVFLEGAWRGNDRLLMYATTDGALIRVFSVRTGRLVHSAKAGGAIYYPVLSPDGRWLAYLDKHLDTVELVELVDGGERPQITVENGGTILPPVRFSADGAHLVVEVDGTALRYNLESREYDFELPISGSWRDGGAFGVNSDGTRLAFVNLDDSRVEVVDFRSGEIVATRDLPYPSGLGSVRDEITFDEGDRLSISRNRFQPLVIDLVDKHLTMQHTRSESFAMSQSGRVAVLRYPNEIDLYDTMLDVSAKTITLPWEESAFKVSLSPNGEKLLVATRSTGSTGGSVHSWFVLRTDGDRDARELGSIAVADMFHLASVWIGGYPYVFYVDGRSPDLLVFDVLRGVQLPVRHSGIGPLFWASLGGEWVAALEVDTSAVRLFQLGNEPRDDREVRLVPQVVGRPSAAAISDDGAVLATASSAGLMLWNGDSRKMFRRLPTSANLADLSSDGTRAISSDRDSVTVWDVASGRVIHTAPIPGARIVRLKDERTAFVCNSAECFSYGFAGSTELVSWHLPAEIGQFDVAAGHDGSVFTSVDLDGSIYWLDHHKGTEKRGVFAYADDRQTIYPVAVEAIREAIVMIGMSDGLVFLVDHDSQSILGVLDVREEVDDRVTIHDIAYINDEKIAIGAGWQVLIVSLDELAVIDRVYPWGREPRYLPEYELTASKDGRRLLIRLPSGLVLWGLDNNALEARLDSLASTPMSVKFGTSDQLLVDDAEVASLWDLKQGRLVRQFRHGGLANSDLAYDLAAHAHATIAGESVVHVPIPEVVPSPDRQRFDVDVTLPKSTESWSVEGGRVVTAWPAGFVARRETVGSVAVSDSDIAVGVIRPFGFDRRGRELWNFDYRVRALLLGSLNGSARKYLRLDYPAGIERFRFDGRSDRLLLDHGRDGLEVASASDGESIWIRKDIVDVDRIMALTHDGASVVVTTLLNEFLTREQELETDLERQWGATPPVFDHWKQDWPAPLAGLMVLDAETGKTRFSERVDSLDEASGDAVLQGLERMAQGYPSERLSMVPALDKERVHGILRMRDGWVQLLSVQVDSVGSVIETANLGISELSFAVTNRDGALFVVADGTGTVVVWDVRNATRATLESTADNPERVALSPDGRLLALAEADGEVNLWDISNISGGVRNLARLVTFYNGDWAVVRDDGRYDASDPGDLNGLVWVVRDAPTDPVSLASFYREFYEPRLLSRLVGGEKFSPIGTIAALDRDSPRVKIVGVEDAGNDRVNVVVQVERASADGVGDVKVFRDGSLVGLDRSATRRRSGDEWKIRFTNIALPTRADVELVEFSSYAFNSDGVKSETARFPYRLPEMVERPRRAFIIVVGVNAYENPSWDLRYAAEDARVTGEVIKKYLEESGVFDAVHAISLTSERDRTTGAVRGSATRADLVGVLDELAGRKAHATHTARFPGAEALTEVTPDDLLFFSFSGHGLSGDDGLFHMFLHDIGTGNRRTVSDDLLQRTLTSDDLAGHLLGIDAGDFVIVIDACNASASVQGKGFKPGPMGSRGLGQMAYDKAMRVLAASQAEEVALESEEVRHGLLTYAMVHEGLVGLKADTAPKDRWIELQEILQYGVERVPRLYHAISEGSFVVEERGLTAFRPSSDAGVANVQQPRLFDFGRHGLQIRAPANSVGRTIEG